MKRPCKRPRHSWENCIKMDIKEIGCRLDLSGSGVDPVAGSCEHGVGLWDP
jgi:hypothetical protein